MAVLYRLTKNNNQYNSGYGNWYAQSVMTETVDTDKLATIMQRNCTVKKSDILAVITELIETMQDQLQNSKRVKLNGFGAFKIGIENAPKDNSKSKILLDTFNQKIKLIDINEELKVSKSEKALYVLILAESLSGTLDLSPFTFHFLKL